MKHTRLLTAALLASLLMFGIVQGIYMKGAKDVVETRKHTEYSVVFYIFTAIFIAMIIYFLYFMIFESPIYIYSEYNKLMS